MFQFALRLVVVEVEQDADAARYAVGNRDLAAPAAGRSLSRAGARRARVLRGDPGMT